MVSDAVLAALAEAALEQGARVVVVTQVIGDHPQIADQWQIAQPVAGFGERLATLLVQQSGLGVLTSLEADVTGQMQSVAQALGVVQLSTHVGALVQVLSGQAVLALPPLQCSEATWTSDGSLKSVAELQALFAARGFSPDKDIITYCAVGGRASQAWFVLTYVLGYPRVRVYDGSWVEWGTLPGVPVET